jgi:hypothetical protein
VPAHLETCSYANPFSEIVWRRITTPYGKAQLSFPTVTAKTPAHPDRTRGADTIAPAVNELYNRLGLVTLATRNPDGPLHTDCVPSDVLFPPTIWRGRPGSPEKTASLPQRSWHRQFARPSHHITYAR